MKKIIFCLLLLAAANTATAQEEKEPREINWGVSPAFLWGASGYAVALNGELYLGKRHLIYGGPKIQLSRLNRYSGDKRIGLNTGYAFRLLKENKWAFYLNPDVQWMSVPSYRNDKISHRWEVTFNFMPVYYITKNIWTGVAIGYGGMWRNVFTEAENNRSSHFGYAGLARINFSYRIK